MTVPARLLRWTAYAAVLGATVLATIVLVFAVQARLRLADLHAWHRVELEDFRANRADMPASFEEYRALEERLFADLRRRVLDDPAAADSQTLSRFNPNSVVAQLAFDTMYNRSYELVPPQPGTQAH